MHMPYTESFSAVKRQFSDEKLRYSSYVCSKHELWVPIIYVLSTTKNQRTNGPVNAHLISGPSISTEHMAEKTLTLITNNPQLTHSVYKINLIPVHRMQ